MTQTDKDFVSWLCRKYTAYQCRDGLLYIIRDYDDCINYRYPFSFYGIDEAHEYWTENNLSS